MPINLDHDAGRTFFCLNLEGRICFSAWCYEDNLRAAHFRCIWLTTETGACKEERIAQDDNDNFQLAL